MNERKAILEKVRLAAWDDRRWVRTFEALESKRFEHLYPIVRGYVRSKFLLDEGDPEETLILDLADTSLRKILRLKKEGKLIGDISRGCSGASSVISKKVLLMKAVQEDFHITLTPTQSAEIQTLDQLTAAISEQKEGLT